MSTPTPDHFAPTTRELVSENSFKIALWVVIGLCILISGLRFFIRLVSFRKFFIEDYLMLFSLVTFIAIGSILQRYLGDIYMMLHVENQVIAPPPDFTDRMVTGLRADGVAIILDTIGIWAIKLNFLSFFRGFGRQIRTYMILWWISLVLVLACGVAHLGVIPYNCVFGSASQILTECASKSGTGYVYTVYKASVAIDVVSDAIIICFPIFIIWRTKINLRQKLILTSVFLLVGFTIAVTIVRGSIFGGVYKSLEEANGQVLDTAWLLFWFMIEYVVSFITACIVSFRSLWVSKAHKEKNKKDHNKARQRAIAGAEKPSRWQRVEESLFKSFGELEGRDLEWDGSMLLQHEPPSGSLMVDFSHWDATTTSGSETLAATSTHISKETSHARTASS